MPIPDDILKKLAASGALDDMMGAGAPPVAPMGTEPPEFYSDAPNAGLGASLGIIQAIPQSPVSPAMRIAIQMEQARRAAARAQ